MNVQGPGPFLHDHPVLFALSLAGALGTAGYAANEARKTEHGRARWWALTGLTVTQAVAMTVSYRRSQAHGDRLGYRADLGHPSLDAHAPQLGS